jgi:acetyl esterase
MLDPQAQALINLMRERGVPATHTLSPAQARRFYLERRSFSQPAAPEMASVSALPAPVPMRMYRPLGSPEAMPLPLLVYFHGGGWTIGDLDTHDVLCRQLANASGCAVASVDYRLGPEHRFPAAVDDCLAATRWLHAQADALNVDAQRIGVGGDSAGGNLAAVVALGLRDAGESFLKFQLLIYPAVDQRYGTPSHQENAQGYLLTADSLAYYRSHYIAEPSQWLDWRASPLLAHSHAGLPPALVVTAGYDPLRDEGRQYADALSAAGTPCQYLCFARQLHGFITMGGLIDEANLAVEVCAAAVRLRLGGDSGRAC